MGLAPLTSCLPVASSITVPQNLNLLRTGVFTTFQLLPILLARNRFLFFLKKTAKKCTCLAHFITQLHPPTYPPPPPPNKTPTCTPTKCTPTHAPRTPTHTKPPPPLVPHPTHTTTPHLPRHSAITAPHRYPHTNPAHVTPSKKN